MFLYHAASLIFSFLFSLNIFFIPYLFHVCSMHLYIYFCYKWLNSALFDQHVFKVNCAMRVHVSKHLSCILLIKAQHSFV